MRILVILAIVLAVAVHGELLLQAGQSASAAKL